MGMGVTCSVVLESSFSGLNKHVSQKWLYLDNMLENKDMVAKEHYQAWLSCTHKLYTCSKQTDRALPQANYLSK